MTIQGVDYSFSHPNVAALKAAGIEFACRYLSNDPSKDITPAELAALHGAGISVVLNWETTADAALRGYQGGLADAKAARAKASALGASVLLPIYYSVDFPDTDTQIPVALDYLHGAADAEGHHSLVGVYGGLATIKAAGNAGFSYLWQTYAWSGEPTVWDPRALIRQVRNDQSIGGASVDLDEAMTGSYGQWYFGTLPTPPSSRPVLSEGSSGPWVMLLQRSLQLAGQALGAVDSAFGPRTLAALRAFQSGAHLAADGICGPLSWGALEARTKAVQSALNTHGAKLAVDGVAGSFTMNAVTKFQSTRGLVADDVVGPLTSKALGL
jgi:hypothetical protein